MGGALSRLALADSAPPPVGLIVVGILALLAVAALVVLAVRQSSARRAAPPTLLEKPAANDVAFIGHLSDSNERVQLDSPEKSVLSASAGSNRMADVTTIDRALDAFMDARNWGETRTVLEEQRDLLLSLEAIERLVFRASLRKNERQRTSMALHARLLLRARDEGIAAAWAWLEDRLVRQKRIETQVEELSQGPEAEMAERLQRMVASFSPTDMQIFQEELEKAEPAPASGAGAGAAPPSRGGVAEAVAEYLGTNSWLDALDLLRERRETLLTAEAERLLREAATRAERAGSHDAARAFTRHAEVLRIARDQGFEAARAYTATSASGGAPMAMAGPASPPVVRTRGPVTPPQKHTGELFPPTDDATGGAAGMTRISTLRPRAPTDEERAAAMALLAIPNLLDATTARAVRAWLELPGYTATPEEIALMRLELREAMK